MFEIFLPRRLKYTDYGYERKRFSILQEWVAGVQILAAMGLRQQQITQDDESTLEVKAGYAKDATFLLGVQRLLGAQGVQSSNSLDRKSLEKMEALYRVLTFSSGIDNTAVRYGIKDRILELQSWVKELRITGPRKFKPNIAGEHRDIWFENSDKEEVLKWLGQQTPETWHDVATGFNWGFGWQEVLGWIVEQPDCDLATALQIFAVSEYADIKNEKKSSGQIIISKIYDKIEAGRYSATGLKISKSERWVVINPDKSPKAVTFQSKSWIPSNELLENII